jgi:hypothetical protein
MAHYEDITIDQGSDAAVEIHLVDENGAAKDLNSYSIAAKMKKNFNSDSSDTTEFTSAITNAAGGIATISLTNTQTDALKAPGRYVYDVEISFVDSDANTIVERVLEGKIHVTPSVTK